MDTTTNLGLRLGGPLAWEQQDDSVEWASDHNAKVMDAAYANLASALVLLGASISGVSAIDSGTF